MDSTKTLVPERNLRTTVPRWDCSKVLRGCKGKIFIKRNSDLKKSDSLPTQRKQLIFRKGLLYPFHHDETTSFAMERYRPRIIFIHYTYLFTVVLRSLNYYGTIVELVMTFSCTVRTPSGDTLTGKVSFTGQRSGLLYPR